LTPILEQLRLGIEQLCNFYNDISSGAVKTDDKEGIQKELLFILSEHTKEVNRLVSKLGGECEAEKRQLETLRAGKAQDHSAEPNGG
jgi:hypothetical protein